MPRRCLVSVLLVLGFASPVLANPIVLEPPLLGPNEPVFTALFGETLVVAFLLWRRKSHFLPVLVTWFFITLVSYGFLFAFTIGLSSVAGLTLVVGLGLPSKELGMVLPCALVISEILVVFFEAHMIARMASLAFYRVAEAPLPRRSAFGVSILGNLTSIVISCVGIFGR